MSVDIAIRARSWPRQRPICSLLVTELSEPCIPSHSSGKGRGFVGSSRHVIPVAPLHWWDDGLASPRSPA
eukprot:688012-Rhodomonas_salina.1